jgi:hypothetical protein
VFGRVLTAPVSGRAPVRDSDVPVIEPKGDIAAGFCEMMTDKGGATIELPLRRGPGQLTDLRDRLRDGQTATLIEDGKPVLAVLPWELYEALLELIQIPGDAQALMSIPPATRRRLLEVAAARAERLYRHDPDLSGFDAFGDDDLYDAPDAG